MKRLLYILFFVSTICFGQQFARPISDVSIGTWTGSPTNTAGNRYQNIDETTESDSDFVRSVNDPSNASVEFALTSLTDPLSSSVHNVRWRIRKGESGGGSTGVINLTITLLQGGTTIDFATIFDLSTTYTSGSFALSNPDLITNYTDLRIRFTANKASGARTSWAEVSWAELEVPNVVAPSEKRIFNIN